MSVVSGQWSVVNFSLTSLPPLLLCLPCSPASPASPLPSLLSPSLITRLARGLSYELEI
jgi:hypothetical protein